MQHDTPYRALEPRAELEQPLAERRDLCPRANGASRAKPKLLHQHVGEQVLLGLVVELDDPAVGR